MPRSLEQKVKDSQLYWSSGKNPVDKMMSRLHYSDRNRVVESAKGGSLTRPTLKATAKRLFGKPGSYQERPRGPIKVHKNAK